MNANLRILDVNGVELRVGAVVRVLTDKVRWEYVGRTENADGSFTPQYAEVPVVETGRITRLTSKWVNVGGVWGGRVFAKRVPLEKIEECEVEWYDNWTKSERYRCM